MPELLLHGRPVRTVFGLLGSKEDDMTFALGWALGQSERLCRALLREVPSMPSDGSIGQVRLQHRDPHLGGRTDVEIDVAAGKLILEAKRGWTLPTNEQLRLYATRLAGTPAAAILTVSECTQSYARQSLPGSIDGVLVQHRSWEDVARLVEEVARGGGHAEKRLLRDLTTYVKGLVTMQDATSNLVYVVSVSNAGSQPWTGTHTPTSLITEHDRYFHPYARRGWPRTPPTYLGFRWSGRLQRVSHVDAYEVFTNPSKMLDGLPDVEWDQHVFYRLGPALPLPAPSPRTGKLFRSQRIWAALDLVLTSPTLAEARDATQARLRGVGAAVPAVD